VSDESLFLLIAQGGQSSRVVGMEGQQRFAFGTARVLRSVKRTVEDDPALRAGQ
jgi:hypothetical protein